LGLLSTAAGDTITGTRLVSGLRDTLVTSLRGGQGLGTLGVVDVTNRNGDISNIDLSSAETLGEIIDAFNSQGDGITASVNAARNGLLLTDATGASVSNFIIADGDANETATALGIVKNVAATKIDGGSLDRRQISEATLLSSLNGGAGIDVGDFLITDTTGSSGAVDLDQTGNVATTLGDVIARINALAIGVDARINDRGDGILLIDTAGGSGKIKVREVGSGTTASGLRILGDSTQVTMGGLPKQVIDGTQAATVTIEADDKLTDLVEKINALNHGVTASIINDGATQRLSLSADKTGVAGALTIDAAGSSLVFDEVSGARDALLLYGSSSSSGGGVLLTSSTNEFKNVIDGIDLTVNEGTGQTVNVNVKSSSASLVTNAKEFVAAYNSLRSNLDQFTNFNEDDLSTGILFGTREALRVDADLSRVITSRFFGVGDFQSLEQVGISLDGKGKMILDEAKLKAAFASDQEGLKKLFTDENLGIAKKLDTAIEDLAGATGSLLSTRTETLSDIIDANIKRLETMDQVLARQRDRLLLEFYRIESTVARLQDNLTALSALQIIPPLTSSSNN
jgi:flagellar hook-associated protein 2